ncbi:hypothetical protein ABPG72_016523 [Tetrahymena utriculariae]
MKIFKKINDNKIIILIEKKNFHQILNQKEKKNEKLIINQHCYSYNTLKTKTCPIGAQQQLLNQYRLLEQHNLCLMTHSIASRDLIKNQEEQLDSLKNQIKSKGIPHQQMTNYKFNFARAYQFYFENIYSQKDFFLMEYEDLDVLPNQLHEEDWELEFEFPEFFFQFKKRLKELCQQEITNLSSPLSQDYISSRISFFKATSHIENLCSSTMPQQLDSIYQQLILKNQNQYQSKQKNQFSSPTELIPLSIDQSISQQIIKISSNESQEENQQQSNPPADLIKIPIEPI